MTIRAGMVNACIKRHHISKEIYGMSEGEFSSYIDELVSANLIKTEKENGIDYYDSTLKSATYERKSLINSFSISNRFIYLSLLASSYCN